MEMEDLFLRREERDGENFRTAKAANDGSLMIFLILVPEMDTEVRHAIMQRDTATTIRIILVNSQLRLRPPS